MADEHEPIPYERFQQVIGEKNSLKADLDAALAKVKEISDKQHEFEELLEASKTVGTQLEQSNAALATAQRDLLRVRVAARTGLPLDLADRLQGDDETALAADAAKVAVYLKPPTPGIAPAPSGGTPPAPFDLSTATPADIRANEAKILAGAGRKK